MVSLFQKEPPGWLGSAVVAAALVAIGSFVYLWAKVEQGASNEYFTRKAAAHADSLRTAEREKNGIIRTLGEGATLDARTDSILGADYRIIDRQREWLSVIRGNGIRIPDSLDQRRSARRGASAEPSKQAKDDRKGAEVSSLIGARILARTNRSSINPGSQRNTPRKVPLA